MEGMIRGGLSSPCEREWDDGPRTFFGDSTLRRVVITGYGIRSSIGNNRSEVLDSLKNGRSGIRRSEAMAEGGLRSHVWGDIQTDVTEEVSRRIRRYMGEAASFAYLAMTECIEHAGLSETEVSNERTGVVVGIGGSSIVDLVECVDVYRNKGHRRVLPYYVPRSMGSGIPANLATIFKIRGANYALSSACATSAHAIGHAAELIQMGKQDRVFAGGGEEVNLWQSVMFDAMGALSSKYNDAPATASRPYDSTRDGFVISGGSGIVCVEALEVAEARGATILAELTGYGFSSDGADMVAPSGEGAVRCMRMALEEAGNPTIDYINTHGTSTPAGDITELNAMREVFGADGLPPLSSTKSMTGHALGAAGSNEAIYCLLMMENNFIAPSINIESLDEGAEGAPVIQEPTDVELHHVLSNSFGFGGTNAALVFSRPAN